tara:strand:+ start:1821 stop:2000 length:180 start_codon:yes stop_codon:yes gene_type:complete
MNAIISRSIVNPWKHYLEEAVEAIDNNQYQKFKELTNYIIRDMEFEMIQEYEEEEKSLS